MAVKEDRFPHFDQGECPECGAPFVASILFEGTNQMQEECKNGHRVTIEKGAKPPKRD